MKIHEVNADGIIHIGGKPYITLSEIARRHEETKQVAWYFRLRRRTDLFNTKVVVTSRDGKNAGRETVVELSDYEAYIELRYSRKDFDETFKSLRKLGKLAPILAPDGTVCLSVLEAVKLLKAIGIKTSASTVRKMADADRLRSVSVGGRLVVYLNDLRDFDDRVQIRLAVNE